MKALREGQCINHGVYGIGIATTSTEDRTIIDFYEHGQKTFATRLFEAELMTQAPPRPPKKRDPAAAAAKKKSAAR